MHVEERTIGLDLTPELRSLVRTVVERSFARIEDHADHVQVRIFSVREGIECRAVLWPRAGAILAVSEIRPSTIEAVIASANGLARELQRRYLARSRKSRRRSTKRRRRTRLDS